MADLQLLVQQLAQGQIDLQNHITALANAQAAPAAAAHKKVVADPGTYDGSPAKFPEFPCSSSKGSGKSLIREKVCENLQEQKVFPFQDERVKSIFGVGFVTGHWGIWFRLAVHQVI